MRVSTAQQLIEAFFGATLEDGLCRCGHPFGPHEFEAFFGATLEGGLYYCQEYPQCPCTGTWGTASG